MPTDELKQAAADWIECLNLQPHPEGGHYRESYRSALEVDASKLGPGFSRSRSVSTAIYYLLEGSDFSAFHRIRSDEMWHHYAGAAVTIHMIDPEGEYASRRLASELEDGPNPQ